MCSHQSEYFLYSPLFSSFMYFPWQNTSLRPHSLTDMLLIIRFTIKERQTFEDILFLLSTSFQTKLWVTFPLEIKSQKSITTTYLSVSSSFLLSPYLTHSSFHMFLRTYSFWSSALSLPETEVGSWFLFALFSFLSLPSYLPHMQITIMLVLQVICSIVLC